MPGVVNAMMHDPDTARRDRFMRAVFKMDKIDLATLEAAYNGKTAA